jgi:hypothetical protein
VKPIKKSSSSKSKTAKNSRVSSGAGAKSTASRKSKMGEEDGPDERRPDVKADEIYGDTEIPESHRK